MNTFNKVAFATGLFAAIFFSLPAQATNLGGLSRSSMKSLEIVNKTTRAPLAYMMFCLSHPAHCQSDNRTTVNYGIGLLATIKYANDKVNNSIRPQNEERDVWSIGVDVGDCEDYALTKRQMLIDAGVPAGVLRMAVVMTEKGEGHAILVVKTDVGDLVLDNLQNNVVLSRNTGYEFLKMASSNPLKWIDLNNSRYKQNQAFDYYT
jgi:predicted transglutaminase-like cysteine proteinase